ncbi:uncharacterized protein LOC135952520 [Calliphora vicina]|uniref:uncharacterized protein LOC135952520 n=1 Tax=Calliphora vicina TaxID=7373 RepID=UPI00325B9E52
MVPRKKYTEGNRTTPKMVCRVCLKDHPLRFCKKILKEDYKERMRLVSFYKYCAGCLSHDHTWRTCESTGKCKHCGDMHNTLLHKPNSRPRPSGQNDGKRVKRLRQESKAKGPSSSRISAKGPSSSRVTSNRPSSSKGNGKERPSTSRALVPATSRRVPNDSNEEPSTSRNLPSYQINGNIILKPTAIIKIITKNRYILERALIDPTAECSVISHEVVRRLDAKTIRIGKSERCLKKIRGNYGINTTIETYAQVLHNYSTVTPKESIQENIRDEFPGLQLADPQFHVSAKAHITLGGDVFPRIIRNGVAGGSFGKPLAQFSIFGYIISGLCSK